MKHEREGLQTDSEDKAVKKNMKKRMRTEKAAVKEKSRQEKQRQKKNRKGIKDIENEGDELFSVKSEKELIAANGVNPNPLEYMTIDDGGQKVYIMLFYVYQMPRRATFADTFSSLFNTPGVTSNVFVDPISRGRATKKLDKRIQGLESEELEASDKQDTNRLRRMSKKRQETEQWASDVESDENKIYEVTFLFSMHDKSLDALNKKAADFYSLGTEKGVELMSCYAVHPEAFLSAEPLNRQYNLSNGLVVGNIAKKHIMDKRSLATIFNHTYSGFRHKNGVFAGYNLDTGHPFMWNPYDKSHNGFGVVFTGKTGTGKSATIKELASRKNDFGAKTVIIDYDAVGTVGEYALYTYKEGGVVYQLSSKSKHILNPYELNVEMEYDELMDKEYLALNLLEKLESLCSIMLTMVKAGKSFEDAADVIFMEDIINEINAELYAERGIVEGEPDSLYTIGAVYSDGKITSGRVKKQLPTIHEFYLRLLEKRRDNRDSMRKKAYAVLTAAFRRYVREMYVCEDTLREFSREEYEKLKITDDNKRIYVDEEGNAQVVRAIMGISPYYDGQSTISVDKDTTVFDIDLSQLPKGDKLVAQTISLSYVNENLIKKNSSNPHNVQELILIIDEAHNLFRFLEALAVLATIYRQARKRHVSPWTITQELTDFKGSKDTEAILKQSTAKFILKQDFQDRNYIAEVTPLTDGQIDRLLKLGGDPSDKEASDARRGEVCLIDNDKVVFIKMVYLKSTEASFVETDVANRQKLYEAMTKGGLK